MKKSALKYKCADETYLKIKGVNHYLYRAVDSKGQTIDFWLSNHRDKKAAKKFFRRALKSTHNSMPRVITTDKYPATEVAIILVDTKNVLSNI